MEINNPTTIIIILTGLLGLFFIIMGWVVDKFAKSQKSEVKA